MPPTAAILQGVGAAMESRIEGEENGEEEEEEKEEMDLRGERKYMILQR